MDFYPPFQYMEHPARFLVGMVESDSSVHWAGRRGGPEAVRGFPLIMICPSAPSHLDPLTDESFISQIINVSVVS